MAAIYWRVYLNSVNYTGYSSLLSEYEKHPDLSRPAKRFCLILLKRRLVAVHPSVWITSPCQIKEELQAKDSWDRNLIVINWCSGRVQRRSPWLRKAYLPSFSYSTETFLPLPNIYPIFMCFLVLLDLVLNILRITWQPKNMIADFAQRGVYQAWSVLDSGM